MRGTPRGIYPGGDPATQGSPIPRPSSLAPPWSRGKRAASFERNLLCQYSFVRTDPPHVRTRPDLHGPKFTQRNYEKLTSDELHQLRRRRGYAKKSPKSALKTRQSTLDQMELRRERDAQGKLSLGVGKRSRSEAMLMASVVEKEVVRQHTPWWDPSRKETW